MDDVIKQKLKEAGLDLAEESVKDFVENTLTTLQTIFVITENKVDDSLIPLIEGVKPYILSQCDKIDGKEG